MQIVIDIPIDDFNEVLKGVICDEIFDDLIDAFRGGIVLPEKHGRLKDVDAIEWYGCTSEAECPYKNRRCKDCDRAECSKRQFDSIPTIIEATEEQA